MRNVELYQAVSELHEEKHYSITHLCRFFEIARFSHYEWLKWKPSKKELENRKLAKETKKKYDSKNGPIGYRQIRMQLNIKLKKHYSRLMKALGIKAVIKKKRPTYVKATEAHVAENVSKRKFAAEKPTQKWCTDITELRYSNGRKAYLSAIIDLYDHSIVSWVLGHSNNNSLVMNTVKKAVRKNPGVRPLLHSDRGFQYTSYDYKALEVRYRFTKSMSRVSHCLDNQRIEHFWGTFKEEEFYKESYQNFEELNKSVRSYMRYYNNYRYSEALNNGFRKQATLKTGIERLES
ncbi:IS3 family transposase [Enterococcus gallinarum]|uniref:IS3 family transposase n=1 Tax=Enterococcus gallinarum TaxID=1353 RepID=UPI0018AAF1C3|nr:IS3 family transposase [Enterococcus gallinarum]MDT2683330.1 IS3 family transposase [Enterococcus gallinarum]